MLSKHVQSAANHLLLLSGEDLVLEKYTTRLLARRTASVQWHYSKLLATRVCEASRAARMTSALPMTERQAAQQAAEIRNLRLQLATQQAECKKQEMHHELQLLLQKLEVAKQQRVIQQQAAEIKQIREQLRIDNSKQQEVVRQQAAVIKQLRQKLQQTKAIALKLLRQWKEEEAQKQALEQLLDYRTQQQQNPSSEALQLLVDFTKSWGKACLANPMHRLQKASGKAPPAAVATPQVPESSTKLGATRPQTKPADGVSSKTSGGLLQPVDSMDCPGTPSRVDSSSGGSTRSSCSGSDAGSNMKGPGTPSVTGSRATCTRSSYSSSDTGTSCSSQIKNQKEPGNSSWWWWGAQEASSTSSCSSNNSESYGSIFSSWWQGGAATGVAAG